MPRPTVLVLLGCFARGVEATGPNQSLLGMVDRLSDRFRFRVLGEAVDGDEVGRWTSVKGVEQMPLTPGRWGVRGLVRALRTTPHDLVIANSIMDPRFTAGLLWARRLRRVPERPLLLAPRGELGSGSLGIRSRRKAIYLTALKRLGLLRGVFFQATTELEAAEIRRALGAETRIFVTPNIRSEPPLPAHVGRDPADPLRVAYLSRIDPKKNLDFALRVIAAANVPVKFDLMGPISDDDYWRQCQQLIRAMPDNVSVNYRGIIAQAQVVAELAGYDLFFLPTRNENFGHAIADAMLAGTPALLSDQTPWRGLADRGAGWDLPLDRPEVFETALRTIAAMPAAGRVAMRAAARAFAVSQLNPDAAAEMLATCLEDLLANGRPDEPLHAGQHA